MSLAATSRRKVRRPAPRRSRGRPAGGDAEVRAALLEAARALFLAHGYGAVSIRAVAAAAGATPAMVHYYFGDKLGLYRAMIETAIQPFLATLQAMRQEAAGEGADVTALMRLYMRTLAANRWLPPLIVQEVLAEGGRFRAQFVEHFAGRLAPLFVGVLERERAAGRLRHDVDPKLAALSALSLCVFPFLSLPVSSQVLGLSVEGEAFERLVEHTGRVFLEGLGGPGSRP